MAPMASFEGEDAELATVLMDFARVPDFVCYGEKMKHSPTVPAQILAHSQLIRKLRELHEPLVFNQCVVWRLLCGVADRAASSGTWHRALSPEERL